MGHLTRSTKYEKTIKPNYQQTKYWRVELKKKKTTTQKDPKEERVIKSKKKKVWARLG
jgi:hypothetical protein